jgi:DNA-binding NtrC family response regulator
MLTGYGTVESAVEAMKRGACDFLKKPCSLSEIEMTIRKAQEQRTLRRENLALKVDLERHQKYSEFVGASQGLRQVLEMIERVARTDSTVLIQGESGVGKELVARALHRNSLRSKGPFVVVDCGSLHENILQSELFGHEKGAYTGAVNLKHGLFEIADTGTLFMDEVSALHPSIQANLLRVLEFGSFRRVGGTEDIHVNVRVLACTNRDLEELIQSAQFREDLYFRLNVLKIAVPPLRERREDIALLVEHFLTHSRIGGRLKKKISAAAMARLIDYEWPGNVRELQNVIERALILAKGDAIEPADLPLGTLTPDGFRFVDGQDEWLPLREMEATYMQAVLRSTAGNKVKAAKILGIDRKTLHSRLTRKR